MVTWIPLEGPSSPHTAMHCPAVFLLLLLAGGAEAFRICAFNAQRLTLAKVAREHVMDTLVRVGSSLQGSCTPKGRDPKPPALPDQGHVPEKRRHQETWVWRHGAHVFPVLSLNLLLCKMGAVWVGMAFNPLPGSF